MKKVPLFLFIAIFLFSTKANAFYVSSTNDSQGVLNLPPFYYAAKDEIRVKYNGREVTQLDWFFTASNGRTHEKTIVAPSGYWYVASGFTCIGVYETNIRNRSGDILATMTIVIEDGDLVSPTCESDGAGETGNDDLPPDGETPLDPVSCATIICECINDLKQVNQQIGQSVDSNGVTLEEIKQNTSVTNTKLDKVNVNLENLTSVSNDILNEFKTDKVVEKPNIPTVELPNSEGRIENNKPKEHDVFEDNTIYFKDEGDAEIPGAMPNAPEPKDWDGVTRENELLKENELKLDGELLKDNELKKENELQLDIFEKDKELNRDVFEKDKEQKKDTFEQTEIYDKTHENYKQNHFYDQTNKFP